MRRLLPRTLFGQMLLVLLAGLVVSYALGMAIYASDRAQAVRAISGYATAGRIATLAQLIGEAPPEWRARIATAASDASLSVALVTAPPSLSGGDSESRTIRSYLAGQLPQGLARRVLAAVKAAPAGSTVVPSPVSSAQMRTMMTGSGMMRGSGMTMAPPAWLRGGESLRSLTASVQLADGQWLAFTAALPTGAPPTPWPLLAATISMAVIVVLVSAWAVSRVVAPLRALAGAAERLGRDLRAPPLALAGTREMRQAAQSFNRMQERIQRLLENRTRMLAALSHDLRTPLTLLRLRTEGLTETGDRERMLATIGELDAMIGDSLAFARDQALSEEERRTDIAALLASIAGDMEDAGLPVDMAPADPVVLACQPTALRRAFTNLIDNAIKYGGTARVSLRATAAEVRIDIDDDGHGIPEAEQQRVFEPFFRLEPSRSRETGGTGLGLAIARQIIEAHGGEIALANRPESGLRVSVSLPR